jgi:hypothetical protein
VVSREQTKHFGAKSNGKEDRENFFLVAPFLTIVSTEQNK